MIMNKKLNNPISLGSFDSFLIRISKETKIIEHGMTKFSTFVLQIIKGL